MICFLHLAARLVVYGSVPLQSPIKRRARNIGCGDTYFVGFAWFALRLAKMGGL